jgi:hypothetical protein
MDDLDKLIEEVEKETAKLRKERGSQVSGDVAPDDLEKEQSELEEQLKTPLKQLDDIAERDR